MSVWTDWDPLEEVIVGNCYTSVPNNWGATSEEKKLLDQIFQETKEDLDNLSTFIESFGIKVHRPKLYEFSEEIELPKFKVLKAMNPIVPRDQYLVYGNTIYQTYTSMSDRYFDSYHYYDIFLELYKNNHNWISQPPPLISNFEFEDKWHTDGHKVYSEDYKDKLLWHTATMFKCGDALITNTSGPGTQLGLEWMHKNINSNCKVLPNVKTVLDSWGHIDQGFFMTDDDTVICMNKDWIPIVLRNKKIIEIGNLFELFDYDDYLTRTAKIKDKHSLSWLEEWFSEWKGYSQDIVFEMNVLVLDSQNVIFSTELPKVFELLKTFGINCHVCKLRHGMFWESGIHCMTLDVKRSGNCRNICRNIFNLKSK